MTKLGQLHKAVPQRGTSPKNQPTRGRRALTAHAGWFRVLALLGIPLLFLLLTEGILRLFGYGYSTSFFQTRQINGQRMWTENRDFGRRFFPPGLVRSAQPIIMPAVKAPGTLRIFVLGESAAMGDPDFKYGLPRMLEVLLRERYPARRIEVINAGVVAINSHVILPIARDCAARQGDLWVIYMGNNEIVGPFGSASVFGARAPALPLVRAGLWLKTMRLGQLLDAGLHSVRARGPAPEWRGMEMMAEQRVSRDSPATQRVYQHFERNLNDLLTLGIRAGLPIILCTVATNLKDCAPFASTHLTGLTDAALKDWQACYEAAVACQNNGNLTNAIAGYERAAQIDNSFADLAFRRAECSRQMGRYAEALKFFREARDEDALQFRADGRVNEMIRHTGALFADRHVALLDAEALFEANGPQGLPGSDYFYEHVHLTPEGNYLLARGLAEQAARLLNLGSAGEWPSPPDCLRLLGLTDWNRYDALNTILDRIQNAPFTNQLDHPRQLQHIGEQLARYRLATKPAQAQRQVAQVAPIVARYPQDADLHYNLATLLQNAGDSAGAEQQWRVVLQLQPQAAVPAYNLGKLLEGRDRPSDALPLYAQALRLDADYYPARYSMGVICLRLNLVEEAIRHLNLAVRQKPASVEARLSLA